MGYQEPGTQDDQLPSSQDEETVLEVKLRYDLEKLRESYDEWHADMGGDYLRFSEFVEEYVRSCIADYQKSRASDELGKSIVWDRITTANATGLKTLLDRCPLELEVHRFLERHPQFLVQVLGGGHGRYQSSKKRLGSEFVPDFLVADMDSYGINWHAVEIEAPCTNVYRRDGLPTQHIHHAIGQIRDWRSWLRDNRDYARRARSENGLGLAGIDSRLPGLILIGRRERFPERYNEFRREQADRYRIMIHSYDWLLDVAFRNSSGALSFALRELESESI